MRDCSEAEQFFDAYLDGGLSGSLRLEFDAHRLRCPVCQQKLAMMEACEHIISGDTRMPALSDDFTYRVMNEIRDRRVLRLRARRTRIVAAASILLPAAAVLLLAVLWPFDFQVYDDFKAGGVDLFEINSNGSVHFDYGGPRTMWVNCGDIPSSIDGQWVAPLGDDLNPPLGGSIWWDVSGVAPDRILTIEWVDIQEYGGTGGTVDLEVNLYEGSNLIVTQYREVIPMLFSSDGVVGINAGDEVRGQELFCAALGQLPSTDFDVWYVHSGGTSTEGTTWGAIKSLYR